MNITSIPKITREWKEKALNEMKTMKSWKLDIIKNSSHATSSLIQPGKLNGFKFFNPKVSRAPLSCRDNCFRVIRDLIDYISLP